MTYLPRNKNVRQPAPGMRCDLCRGSMTLLREGSEERYECNDCDRVMKFYNPPKKGS